MSKYQSKYNQAVSAYLLEDYELSRKMTDQLLKEMGNNTLLLILSGNIYEALKETSKAIADYKAAIRLSPENPEAYNNLGVAYKNSGDFAKAETAFLQASELAPDRADISYNLGNLFKKNEDYESAELWYKKSIEQDPSYIKAYNNLGTIFEKNKDYEKAEDIYKQGLSMDKNNATLHFNLGITYQDRGDLEQAQNQYEESLKYRPGWTPSLGNLGEVLQNQGNLEEAEQTFAQLLNKEPENIRAINSMGTIHAQKGDDAKARQFFKKALTKDPTYKAASLNLKQIYMKDNSLQEALEELNKQANYHPEDMSIRLQIGIILKKLERYKEAERVYNHILDRQRDSLEAYKALAELYAIEQRPDLVRSCVVEISKIDPKDKSVLMILSETYYKSKRYEDALTYINDYLESDSENPKALRLKAKILQHLDKQEEAAELYTRLEDDPETRSDPAALTDMAEVYFKSGKKEKAVEKLESLLNMQGSSGDLKDINDFAQTLELYEKTVSSFQEGSENWTKNLDKMRQITIRDMGGDELAGYSAGPRMEKIPLEEEDAVSLLDINAMEPVIRINEEEENLFLEEDMEDLSDVYSEMMEDGVIPDEEKEEEILPSPTSDITPGPVEYPPMPPMEAPQAAAAPEPQMASSDAAPSSGSGGSALPPVDEKGEKLDIAGMMNYLFNLSHDLPEEKRQVLIDKAIPLKMASVIKRLSGGEQFKEKVSSYDRRNRTRPDFNVSESKMHQSLSAFKNLTEQHPDDLISSAFTKKMDELMTKIKPYI